MSAFGGVHAAAALLLVVSGAAKMTAPAATQRSMRNAGLPSNVIIVRALGAAEILVGSSSLVVPGPLPVVAQAALYLGFAVFVARVMTSGSEVGCGCFGVSDDSPPGWTHLGIVGAAAGAALATLGDDDTLFDVLGSAPAQGTATAVCVVAVAVLAAAALTTLPATRAAAASLRPRQNDRETDESIPR